MSVLACNRHGCDNIMCDRLILGNKYYVCSTCWAELLEYRATWEPYGMTLADVRINIEWFMDTVPGIYQYCDETDIEAEFKMLTNQNG